MKYFPPFVILQSLLMFVFQRVSFPKYRVGKTIIREDGKKFRIFREIQVKAIKDQQTNPKGVFQVWFSTKVKHQQTILLSKITLLGFLGLPGFRSKLWLINDETKEFSGIYEWDRLEDTHNYDKSYTMKFSHWRSLPNRFRKIVLIPSDTRTRVQFLD